MVSTRLPDLCHMDSTWEGEGGVRRTREPDDEMVESPAKSKRRIGQSPGWCKTLGDLFAVLPPGPPDFGGRIAELLWGVRIEYSSTIEYLRLFMGNDLSKTSSHLGVRRIVTPELFSLLRCCRAVRLGIIAAVEVRRRTIEPDASNAQRHMFIQISNTLKNRFPDSWNAVKDCCTQDYGPDRVWPALVVTSF